MIGNEEGTGGTSTLNPTRLRPPRKPSRNGYTPPSRRSNPKPLPQKEDPGSNPSGHPHSCRKTPNSHPGAEAGACARVEPEVAGGTVTSDQINVTVPVEVTDSHELVHRVPATSELPPG